MICFLARPQAATFSNLVTIARAPVCSWRTRLFLLKMTNALTLHCSCSHAPRYTSQLPTRQASCPRTSQEPRPEQELEAKLAAKLSCLIKLLAAGGEAGAFKGFLPSLITHPSTRANSGGLTALFEATDPTYRMSRVR